MTKSIPIQVQDILSELRPEGVHGVCIEREFVVCVNGVDPPPQEHWWLIEYLNRKLHGDYWLATAFPAAVTMVFPQTPGLPAMLAAVAAKTHEQPDPLMRLIEPPEPTQTTWVLPNYAHREKPGAADEFQYFAACVIRVVKENPVPLTSADLIKLLEEYPKDRLPPKSAWHYLLRFMGEFGERPFERSAGQPNVRSTIGRNQTRYWMWDPK